MELRLVPIYEQLLTEAVDRNKIIDAIKNKRLINIYYESPHDKDKDDYPKGWRRIEPFCCGVNHYDNGVLRAWELHGVSYSYPPGKDDDPLTHTPGWRMFRLDGISSINEAGNDRFTSPRPKYNPEDKDMKIIYAAADFGGSGSTQQPSQPVSPTNTPASQGSSPQQSTTTNIPSSSSVPVSPTSTSFDSGYKSVFDKSPNVENPSDDENQFDSKNAEKDQNTNPNKPTWFQKFGDNFKKLVNFGKSDKNKI